MGTGDTGNFRPMYDCKVMSRHTQWFIANAHLASRLVPCVLKKKTQKGAISLNNDQDQSADSLEVVYAGTDLLDNKNCQRLA